MRQFTIIPSDKAVEPIKVSAIDESGLLALVGQLDCREAAGLEGGEYKLSLHLDEHQVWHIFTTGSTTSVGRARVTRAPSQSG